MIKHDFILSTEPAWWWASDCLDLDLKIDLFFRIAEKSIVLLEKDLVRLYVFGLNPAQ